jgi:peptidoglycan hydrolase CwlO-like protein
MTNASSTYLGIAGGAIIGAIVSWWVYNRQKKTADMQDSALNSIKELDESHDRILKKLEDFDTRHETTLNTITELSKKIDDLIEKQEKSENPMKSDSSKITKDSK